MMIGKDKNKISYMLLRLVWKLTEIDKRTRNYGTDQLLYEAEIHMIKAIKENKGIHITGLAERFGVTKGAVSQIIGKILKKGMIVKEADPTNHSRLMIFLSEKGEVAYSNHEALHRLFDDYVEKLLVDASVADVKFLRNFLLEFEKGIGDLENNN